jgi:polyisoprenyl-teichoic acid--peptidoglycan teichoic acid transferase
VAILTACITIPVVRSILGTIVVVKGVQRTHNSSVRYAQASLRDRQGIKHSLGTLRYRLLATWHKNPLLSWTCLITFCILLGANTALLTPIWSDRAPLSQEEQLALLKQQGNKAVPFANSQYQIARPVNILVLGIDPVAGSKGAASADMTASSDTILLLRVNPNSQLIKVLSIPRSSMVVLPEVGLEKIALANTSGAAIATRVVSKSLNNVPIDRYLRLRPDGLRELVNALGGVEVFVPQGMSYQDATQKLAIDLQPGWQTLNGDQAQQFARFQAGKNGDLGRVQRQQLLIQALKNRLTNPAVIAQLPQIVSIVQNYMDTNLSPEEMLTLANFGARLDAQNLQMVMLPGNLSSLSLDSNSYWLDANGQDRVMSEYFGTTSLSAPKMRSLSSLKIAVQNASGQPSLSRQVVDKLKAQGFENVYPSSDWQDRLAQTEIVVQRGDLKAATELQKVLGLGKVEVSATGDLDSYLTLRLGKDWQDK